MTKSKTTKKALLSSVLALVLCFTMLLGTTFAWFTDTASTSVNTIQAGTLDIELLDANGASLEGQTLSWQKAAGHENEDVLWEPGCTYELQPITIKNSGNLALKYKVVIAGIDGSAKLNEVIDWTIDGVTTNTDRSLAVGATETLTISGHMQESAGNEYQRETIEGVAITVYATQDTVEYDSTTNQYDKNATYDEAWDGTTSAVEKGNDGVYHISTAAQFAWVMKRSQNTGLTSIYSGEKFVLDANIDFGGATITGFSNESVKFGGSFDGQGYTVSNFVINRSDREDYAGLFNYYSYGTIENLNVKNATVIGLSKVGALLGSIDDGATVKNCTVENCTVIADREVGGVVGYAQGAAVNNITVKNTTVYCETSEQAYGKDQWGQVIGYKNTGYSESGNIAGDDVVVKTGVTYTAVSTAEALATALDNTGNAPSYARNIILTADIDGSAWTAIPGGSNYPAVTINGNGHTIRNLAQPLFSSLPGRDFVFENINFTNVNITSASNTGLAVIVGEGMANGGGSYTITNCHINGGTIDGGSTYYVGGFIGFKSNGGNVTFKDCSVNNLTLKTSEESVGAFAGHLYDTVTLTNCSVKGNTSVTNSADRDGKDAKAGAFVGTVYSANVTNCNVDTTVTVSNSNAKDTINNGMFGRTAGGTITVG